MSESREHQVVWVSPERWLNDVEVKDIHQYESRTFGYCTLGSMTWLVQQIRADLPVWVIVGWVRTTE